MQNIRSVKAKYTGAIMRINGVVGVGIAKIEEEEIIQIMVKKYTKRLAKKIPPEIEGYRTNIIETGELKAL